ncbi:thioredoxin family protein [Rhizomicrobium electricum]|jgi:putative thioredoxin|uniref:Co-chaperone YbbN n=1 Tax=Rhizomicrobium electricum TaxID=480070 RepID=A0ABP3Q998_9PROT|nr:co-chaperone YbbN [Rhizomicrobium electricum]NIJ50603.1 putative thioredoxin [Rhizomicrobium electricum]
MVLFGSGGTPKQDGKDGSASPYIKEASIATFAADVLEASREVPVIVDFWSPRSPQSKEQDKHLEAAVAAANGAVKLVKVNVDENIEIARQLRIQAIPTVYVFQNGQPVDGFAEVLPEAQIKKFVQGLAGGAGGHDHAAEVLTIADQAFEAGDIGQAAQAYAHVLQDEPGNPKAVAGLARCYLKGGDIERTKQTLALVSPEHANDEAVRAVTAELTLRETAAAAVGKTGELEAKLAANPNDHQARYDLALALEGAGDRDGAIEQLLDIVRRDRKWNEEAARKQLVTLFDAMGPTDDRTIAARRKLSSILFS